jgi:hypothetical protein
MPIKMELVENGQVIHYVFTDPWTVPELMKLYEQNQAIRDKSPRKIHTLVNLTRARHLPHGTLSARAYSPDGSHPRAGFIVIVGAQTYLRTILDLAFHLLRTDRFKFVNTEEEGWAILQGILRGEAA